jgi:hypothetical protein
MTIWYTLWPFALLSSHLLYFVVICYIFPIFFHLFVYQKNLVTLIHPEASGGDDTWQVWLLVLMPGAGHHCRKLGRLLWG